MRSYHKLALLGLLAPFGACAGAARGAAGAGGPGRRRRRQGMPPPDPNAYPPQQEHAQQAAAIRLHGAAPDPVRSGAGLLLSAGRALSRVRAVRSVPVPRVRAAGSTSSVTPADFGYQQQMWGYQGNHPIPGAYGGGYCFIDWPHRHHYAPPATLAFNYVGGYYVYGGPWDPWYWRMAAALSGVLRRLLPPLVLRRHLLADAAGAGLSPAHRRRCAGRYRPGADRDRAGARAYRRRCAAPVWASGRWRGRRSAAAVCAASGPAWSSARRGRTHRRRIRAAAWSSDRRGRTRRCIRSARRPRTWARRRRRVSAPPPAHVAPPPARGGGGGGSSSLAATNEARPHPAHRRHARHVGATAERAAARHLRARDLVARARAGGAGASRHAHPLQPRLVRRRARRVERARRGGGGGARRSTTASSSSTAPTRWRTRRRRCRSRCVGLDKPVVLTGSQRPLGEIRSDARRNLVDAVDLATRDIPEVGVCFDGRAACAATAPPRATPGRTPRSPRRTARRWRGSGSTSRSRRTCGGRRARSPSTGASTARGRLLRHAGHGPARSSARRGRADGGARGVVLAAFGVGNVPSRARSVAAAVARLVDGGVTVRGGDASARRRGRPVALRRTAWRSPTPARSRAATWASKRRSSS